MRPFTVEEIIKAVDGTLVSGEKENIVYRVCTDSRKAEPGDLFFPLKGENNDGHDFLGQVLEAGCRTIVVSDESKIPKQAFASQPGDADIIVVDDTTAALQALASYYLDCLPLKKKIAVTGSVGKTSTRDMLYYAASTSFKTGRNPKNFNNYFGLPLSIMDFEPDTEVAVLEMGMASAGEIETLARIARPDIAVITNIGVSHIENLGSREGILKAKLEVTCCFDENSVLVINADNDMLTPENVKGPYRVITVGTGENCDYRINDVCDFGDKGIEYTLCHEGKDYRIKLPVPGAHNAINASLAVAAAGLMGISPETAIKGFEQAELTEKRLNIKKQGRIKVIDDTYNACPESMKSALNTLMSTDVEEGGRRVAVLGDMFELGKESPAAHLEVGRYAVEKKPDLLIAVGKDAEYIAQGAEPLGDGHVLRYETREDLEKEVHEIIRPGDTVLVKASRSMEMEKTVKEILKEK